MGRDKYCKECGSYLPVGRKRCPACDTPVGCGGPDLSMSFPGAGRFGTAYPVTPVMRSESLAYSAVEIANADLAMPMASACFVPLDWYPKRVK